MKKFDVIKKIEDWLGMKNKSRKLFLLYVVIILSTLGTFVPPTLTWILQLMHKNVVPFEILGSTEWVSMMTIVVSSYFGTNVWEKHVALSNGVQPSQLDNACMTIKGSPGTQLQQDVKVDVNVNQNDADKQALKDALKHSQQ